MQTDACILEAPVGLMFVLPSVGGCRQVGLAQRVQPQVGPDFCCLPGLPALGPLQWLFSPDVLVTDTGSEYIDPLFELFLRARVG